MRTQTVGIQFAQLFNAITKPYIENMLQKYHQKRNSKENKKNIYQTTTEQFEWTIKYKKVIVHLLVSLKWFQFVD